MTVQADANTLQTESAAVGQLVTTDQVRSIQLNGRNPIYLSQLEPGVTRNAPLSYFKFRPDFSGPTINGARSNESALTFDGAPMIRTRANGTSIGVADIDTISQVQILTTTYPALYGGTAGGVIVQVPRSGTNDFHGAVYEYLRNSLFNADTWKRNQSDQSSIANPHRHSASTSSDGPSVARPLFRTPSTHRERRHFSWPARSFYATGKMQLRPALFPLR